MSDNNNWPDPARPGVPMNPEQDSEGYVWRVDGRIDVYKWVADNQWYEDQKGFWVTPDQLIADGDTYFGRIVTPAEVEARVADALKWRGAINDALTNWLLPIEDHETPKDALQRLIRLEVMAALDPKVSKSAADLVAQAKRDGRQEAARVAEELIGRAYRIGFGEGMKEHRSSKGGIPWHDSAIKKEGAAAIRALKGEGDE